MDKDAQEERKENIAAIAIVVVVVAVLSFFVYRALQPAPQPDDVRVQLSPGNSPMLGNDTAPVTVIEFSDFECPYCGTFALEHFPEIEERFIDTGEVRFAYKHFPLSGIHPDAEAAALASECAAAQDAFWEYHDGLYAIAAEKPAALTAERLVSYAATLGLNTEEFRECLVSERYAHIVREDKREGERAGVTGTPTFFFNGRRVVGVLTPAQFAAEVEAELADLES